MIARPTSDTERDEAAPNIRALLSACGDGGRCEPRLRELLMALREARYGEVRAIERYLGLGPPRSERDRKGRE